MVYKKMVLSFVLYQRTGTQELGQNTEIQFKEKRGQNTIIFYPNEICDLLSQNNIPTNRDSRNSNIETDSEMRSITGVGSLR